MKRKYCVLIDDDVEEHLIFSMALAELADDTECSCFTDCEQAIAFLATSSVHPVGYTFLDMHTGRTTMEECLHQLANLSTYTSARIILYTSQVRDEVYQRLLELRVSTILNKNASIEGLAADLKSLFDADSI